MSAFLDTLRSNFGRSDHFSVYTQYKRQNNNYSYYYRGRKFCSYYNYNYKSFLENLSDTDYAGIRISPGLATIFALSAAWIALPFMWTALAWMILAAALITIGRRFADRVLCTCGHFAAIAALLAVVFSVWTTVQTARVGEAGAKAVWGHHDSDSSSPVVAVPGPPARGLHSI